MPKLLRHISLHGLAWLLLLALASVIKANYRIAINRTPSLPYSVYLICLNDTVEPGGFIAFYWHNGKPFPNGTVFTKRLLAATGDKVIKHGRDVMVGGVTLHGKEYGITGRKLFPNDQLLEGDNIIPAGKYFVAGDHEYSLDSRYGLLGLVDREEVIGRAYPIF
jgi:conjugal transfer pilin signal peptidase TrbI